MAAYLLIYQVSRPKAVSNFSISLDKKSVFERAVLAG